MTDQGTLDFAEAAPRPAPSAARAEASTDVVLFGADPTDRVVAVEPADDRLVVWRRPVGGKVERSERPFRPWMLCPDPRPDLGVEPQELEGDGLRFLHQFDSWAAFTDARFRIREEHAEHLTYPSGARQGLISSGLTLFKGMAMSDVVRMQVDIETEGLSREDESNHILLIAVRDTAGLLETLIGDESEMLERFVALVGERDPDVLEGHNIYGFDLPFLLARAQRRGVRLALGRDGSEIRTGTERNFAIGGITRPFTPVYVNGRHVIDTYLAVQRFDWAKGSLTGYGLKEVARAFGIAETDRVDIPRGEVGRVFREDPLRVREYATHDVIETGRLAELVAPTEFYQTQMVPDSYGGCAVSGNGDKINCIFVRAYLHARRAIPRPQASRPYAGGYTEVRATGVLDHVVKADVESLYPSIMLSEDIHPESDTLGIFLPALAELTRRRLDAKARSRTATGTDRHYWDGLQGSFKVLINSFYGYLGAPSFNFNDYAAAERVTERGREIVKHIAEEMEKTGSRIIEIDTDGVYFVPPADVQGEDAEHQYVARVGKTLPEGIRLAFDGRYRTMVSLKTKNYVLYDYEGRKTFKGASLRSRADEAYGREFLEKAIDLLLEHRLDEIGQLYERTIDDILNHRMPIAKLARRERVTDKTFTSSAKHRSAAVAGNTAVGEYIVVYERQDGSLGLLEDHLPSDENTTYYVGKLRKFASRLQEAFGGRFDELFPKPTAHWLAGRHQSSLELF